MFRFCRIRVKIHCQQYFKAKPTNLTSFNLPKRPIQCNCIAIGQNIQLLQHPCTSSRLCRYILIVHRILSYSYCRHDIVGPILYPLDCWNPSIRQFKHYIVVKNQGSTPTCINSQNLLTWCSILLQQICCTKKKSKSVSVRM